MITENISGGGAQDPAWRNLNLGVGKMPPVTEDDLKLVPAALQKFRNERDARSLAGIYFFLGEIHVPPDLEGFKKELMIGWENDKPMVMQGLENYGNTKHPEFNIGSLVDTHFRLRARGVNTVISEDQAEMMEGVYNEAIGLNDGWGAAHLGFHLPRLGVPVDRLAGFSIAVSGSEGLIEATNNSDAVAMGFLGIWALDLGGETVRKDFNLSEEDDRLMKTALKTAREEGDGRTVFGMHYVLQKLYESPPDHPTLNTIPLK